ncbi:tRNA (cytidine(34)-2'-O)-methyltransferase [Kordia antarctica]|uniref:Putative tRNA (cytidine(34)-2'-O)-methyltransferase n=1 Tax=Kordia antarctica TaxID=1218801 RepID=A0A7L4ZIM1_9FLAO|nr:tRNA (cytidine(34)-2'-O)-methyltransferase [Kordia antarctica]QHI36351.1 tRNA (cytidine(34)-2'-O)-methyltransferase [Kordia antarctica]
MAYNIVLIEPEIPTNTGNIGRLSLASGSNLHLVKPFGFEITDARLKRAGLDYWQHLSVHIYENIEEFYVKNSDKKMVYLSSHGNKTYDEIPFEDDLFIIFGKESVGLSKNITDKYPEDLYTIPMFSEHIRSLNLANAVAIVVFEGIRRLKF